MKNIQKVFSKKKVCDNQSGFTLLEVLIAISILTVGLLGVAQMQIMGIKGNYFSGNTTAALGKVTLMLNLQVVIILMRIIQ